MTFLWKKCQKNEMKIIPILGLTAGSYQDFYSRGVGYLTFVRGNYSDGNGDIVSNIETENDENTLPVQVLSKESRIDK